MILISLEPWDLVNEVWMWFRTKWVHKSNDLLHGICLYLKNIINLCTDNTAKAHRDRGWCVARQIPGAKAQKWGCCKGSRESLERSMRAHIALQMPQSCWQHSCELMCTGSTSGSLQAGQSNTYLSLQSGLICWYFKKKYRNDRISGTALDRGRRHRHGNQVPKESSWFEITCAPLLVS